MVAALEVALYVAIVAASLVLPGFLAPKSRAGKGASSPTAPPSPLLRANILFGVTYYYSMATAHYFGFKYPLLFIFFDPPFFAYQDKIIAFCVIVYATFFMHAANNKAAVPAALTAYTVTILGLISVIVSADLDAVLNGASKSAYWTQTIAFSVHLAVLLGLQLREK